VADTWGHQQARAHEEWIVLNKSRWQLTKSSGGTRRLGDWAVEDDGDTCRDRRGGVTDLLPQLGFMVWASKPVIDYFWVWALKPSWSFGGNKKQHVASLGSLHQGEAKSRRACGHRMHRSSVGAFFPG
jgi:hypothetical protein